MTVKIVVVPKPVKRIFVTTSSNEIVLQLEGGETLNRTYKRSIFSLPLFGKGRLLIEIGEAGAELVRALAVLPGVTRITVESDCVTVEKSRDIGSWQSGLAKSVTSAVMEKCIGGGDEIEVAGAEWLKSSLMQMWGSREDFVAISVPTPGDSLPWGGDW